LREITGIDHINPHTFRHLAVTELLEQGAPEDTVIALAGWVGRRMVETYSHARIEAKADAVQLLAGLGAQRPERREPRTTIPPPIFQKFEPREQRPAVDIMNPAIRAEIARQVALALQQERQKNAVTNGTRVIRFPGAGF
jgi:hypothetical protein